MANSSFWIFGLAVIVNSIELSSQSGTPSPQPESFRESRISSRRGYRFRDLPYRLVRCPTDEQRTDKTTFLLKHANGTYEDCTQNKILLAVGPVLIGFVLDDGIRPISTISGCEILYDETTNEQINVSTGYVHNNFGLFGPVPEKIRHLSVIDPFGVFSPKRTSNPTRPRSPTAPARPILARSDSERVPGFLSRFESDSISSSATSGSSSRSSKSFVNRIFNRPSRSYSKPPFNEASSSGKKD